MAKTVVHGKLIGEYETVAVVTVDPDPKATRIVVARVWDPSREIESRGLTPELTQKLSKTLLDHSKIGRLRFSVWPTTNTEVEIDSAAMRQLFLALQGKDA